MAGPLDRTPDGKDLAESENEAANRQNNAAEADIEAGYSPPGGVDTQSAGATGPTGQPHASSRLEGMASEGDLAREGDNASLAGSDIERIEGGDERGMLGEGV